MPITPQFCLSQELKEVIVEIRVPHVRVSVQSLEVVVEGPVLHFSSPPYLLVLTFPASLRDDENHEGCATFDPSNQGGMVTLRLFKAIPSLWPNLDLVGALVAPKQPPPGGGRAGGGGISVISSSDEPQSSTDLQKDDQGTSSSSSASFDWKHALGPRYGFLRQHAGVFGDLAREGLAAEMLELSDPDDTEASERRGLRLAAEEETFCPERYLGDVDMEEDYIYQSALNMVPHWREQPKTDVDTTLEDVTQQLSKLSTQEGQNGKTTSSTHYFTAEETVQLAEIPYPLLPDSISPLEKESLLLGLLDILFAYVHDHLTTDGDPTIESSWAVCTLSCTLSWLEEYAPEHDTLQTVIQHSLRRALIYPYIRNFEFGLYCWKEVACIIRKGPRCIVRCLLQTRNILDKSECHYLGNRLYMDPYLAWIQRRLSTQEILVLSKRLDKVLAENVIEKDSLGLHLVALERQFLQVEASSEESQDSSSESDGDEDDSEQSSSSEDEESMEEKQESHSTELLDSNFEGQPAVQSDPLCPEPNDRPKVLIEEI